MAAQVGFQIEGVEEARRKIRRLMPKQQRAVYRNAWRKAGRIVEKEARMRAPEDEGDLKRGISTAVSATNTGVKADVGVRKGKPGAPARYYGFIELGTAHSAPRPYLRPALATKRDEAVRSIAGNLRDEVMKVAKKAGL